MKIKKHILTLSLILATVVGYAQSFNYQLNYGSIKFGNSATGQHQFNGLANFVNGITIPLRAESDSSANAASTQWVKRLVQGLTYIPSLAEVVNVNNYASKSFGINNGGYISKLEVTEDNNVLFVNGLETDQSGWTIGSDYKRTGVLSNRNLYIKFDGQDGVKSLIKGSVNKGLEYDGNFESNFTSRSLVDKRYVDSVANAASTSGVTSVNGRTGAVTGLAELSGGNTFSGDQVLNNSTFTASTTANQQQSQYNYNGFFAVNFANNKRVGLGSFNGNLFFSSGNFDLNVSANITAQREQNFQDKDGTIALLSDITNAGGNYELLANKSTTLTSPSNTTYPTTLAVSNALATKQNIDEQPFKPSVRIATTANITLSGLLTIDGVTLVAGDRVLVKNQTTASQNGIYIAASGAWSRSADSDSATELNGSTVTVTAGTINSGSLYNQTSSIVTVGTTAVNYLQSFKAGTNISTSGNTISLTANPSIGSATATTQTAGTNNTTVSTTAFTQNAISGKANLSGGNVYSGSQSIQGVLSVNPATGTYPFIQIADNGNLTAFESATSQIGINGSTGRLAFTRGSFTGTINNPTLTANRTWDLPNKTGTFALTSDVSALSLQDVTNVGNTIAKAGDALIKYERTGVKGWDAGVRNNGDFVIGDGPEINLVITENGRNVGIGKTPLSRLDVDGSARASANDGNANTLVRNTDLSNYALKTPVFSTAGTSATLVSSGRYIPQNASLTIYTLPTTAAVGDVIFINGKGAGGWRISQNTGQIIHGATDTTTGSAGYVGSTARYNSIAIVCVTANTEWIIQSSQGSLTIN